MIDISNIDYSNLDQPEILMFLFHPRPEYEYSKSQAPYENLLIPVDTEVLVGARFHMAATSFANILFFHGNGEIAADYDEMAPLYNGMDINFLVADYRGYGRSTGRPTITAMMRDCHVIFDFVLKWLQEKGYTGPLMVMGRSLGSASAIELASNYKDKIQGLVIESGFARSGPLLELIGADLDALGFSEDQGLRNMDKIKTYDKPTLIIHAQYDHLIPFSEGKSLYEASPSTQKTLLQIPGANHNDIFFRGEKEYMEAIKSLVETLKR
jgi:pimeloyl-ACP methyl ester carboxylesterase